MTNLLPYRKLWYVYGWIFVRPRRYVYARAAWNSKLVLWPRKEHFYWKLPNLHWWILNKTLHKFCSWLACDAWRLLRDWTGGARRTFPFVARVIEEIGSTTFKQACWGHQECFHCASKEGNPIDLAYGDNEETTYSDTSYGYEGDANWDVFTICPICGYKDSFSDGT